MGSSWNDQEPNTLPCRYESQLITNLTSATRTLADTMKKFIPNINISSLPVQPSKSINRILFVRSQ